MSQPSREALHFVLGRLTPEVRSGMLHLARAPHYAATLVFLVARQFNLTAPPVEERMHTSNRQLCLCKRNMAAIFDALAREEPLAQLIAIIGTIPQPLGLSEHFGMTSSSMFSAMEERLALPAYVLVETLARAFSSRRNHGLALTWGALAGHLKALARADRGGSSMSMSDDDESEKETDSVPDSGANVDVVPVVPQRIDHLPPLYLGAPRGPVDMDAPFVHPARALIIIQAVLALLGLAIHLPPKSPWSAIQALGLAFHPDKWTWPTQLGSWSRPTRRLSEGRVENVDNLKRSVGCNANLALRCAACQELLWHRQVPVPCQACKEKWIPPSRQSTTTSY